MLPVAVERQNPGIQPGTPCVPTGNTTACMMNNLQLERIFYIKKYEFSVHFGVALLSDNGARLLRVDVEVAVDDVTTESAR